MKILKQEIIILGLFLFLFSTEVNCKKFKCKNDGILALCSTESDPVCAFFKKDICSKKLSQLEGTNACTACNNKGVVYYEKGPCKGNKVYCDPFARPEFCTEEFNPVCAFSKGRCRGGYCKTTAGNKCSACADTKVEFYIRGECDQ